MGRGEEMQPEAGKVEWTGDFNAQIVEILFSLC